HRHVVRGRDAFQRGLDTAGHVSAPGKIARDPSRSFDAGRMKRAHSMPFGAERAGGGARFRLWAPACDSVELLLGRPRERSFAMHRTLDGWHAIEVPDVAVGTPYSFKVDGGDPVADPASRSNPWDPSGPSVLVDPRAYEWQDDDWPGRPWREAVVYELHI